MSAGTVAVVRKLKASPRAVWRTFTEPQTLRQWFAPADGFSVIVAEADVRVGGRYRLVTQSPDGSEHDVSGIYREIVPNEKLVFTWEWPSTPDGESVVTVELTPAGDGTELVVRHEHFPDRQAFARQEQAWRSRARRLARLLA